MHPADVAEHVANSYAEIVRRLGDRPELTSGPPQLQDDVRLFVPFDLTARRVVDARLPSDLVLPGGQAVGVVHRAVLLGESPTTRPLLLALDLTDYDSQPPTAELLLPDRSPLPAEEWPKSVNVLGVVNGHCDYHRPWFCRPGLREYHTHPQHEDDPWDRHREGLPLHSVVIGLLTDLSKRFIGK